MCSGLRGAARFVEQPRLSAQTVTELREPMPPARHGQQVAVAHHPVLMPRVAHDIADVARRVKLHGRAAALAAAVIEVVAVDGGGGACHRARRPLRPVGRVPRHAVLGSHVRPDHLEAIELRRDLEDGAGVRLVEVHRVRVAGDIAKRKTPGRLRPLLLLPHARAQSLDARRLERADVILAAGEAADIGLERERIAGAGRA